MAEILLDAEVKLGEILKDIEPKRMKESSTQGTSLPSLPPDVTKKQSHQAQTLSQNRDFAKFDTRPDEFTEGAKV